MKPHYETYGLSTVKPDTPQLQIELTFVRMFGYINQNGGRIGRGMYHHMTEAQKLMWPKEVDHKWDRLIRKELCDFNAPKSVCGITGPGSSGKTHGASKFVLCMFYANPDRLTALCSTTTKDALDLRIFGEIKMLHKKAKNRYPWLPGHLRESKQQIVRDAKKTQEGRDFRNGVLGIACRVGGKEVNLANFVGIKNEIMILVADELQMMNKHYLSALSNLRNNPWFLFVPLGNPLDQQDALGQIIEPEGGYDNYPYEFETTVYKTKYPEGKVVRLCGLDSPNMDSPEGQPKPYSFLLGRDDIKANADYYGTESLQYYSMSLGILSRTGSARRVITKQLCELNRANEPAVFGPGKITKLASLDAAYSGSDGDRCVLLHGAFGEDRDGNMILGITDAPIIVPVNPTIKDITPEDQIARYCNGSCVPKGISDSDFFYDSTGRGSLGPSLAREWGTGINPVEFGGVASDRPVPEQPDKTCREAYFNKVTELWWTLRLAIATGQIRGMTSDMIEEASQREYMMVSAEKKIQVEPKKNMKERTGRSPDLVDSLVCLLDGAIQRGFRIKGIMRNAPKEDDDNWIQKQATKVKQTWKKKTSLQAA